MLALLDVLVCINKCYVFLFISSRGLDKQKSSALNCKYKCIFLPIKFNICLRLKGGESLSTHNICFG